MNDLILYSSIANQFQSSWHVPYQFLLRTYEWKTFRDSIVYRDNSKCTICCKEQSEKIGKKYYRKPNAEEIAENLKEITIDFFGDGIEVHKLNHYALKVHRFGIKKNGILPNGDKKLILICGEQAKA